MDESSRMTVSESEFVRRTKQRTELRLIGGKISYKELQGGTAKEQIGW